VLLTLRLIAASAVLCAAASVRDGDNALSDEEKKAGWKLLFDGKTTEGWRGWKKDKMPDGWQVVDGALTRVKGSGDIITVDQYENFELALDWRLAAGGNSGIMYLVQETDHAPYETGPEYQLLDEAKHGITRTDPTATGSCYALYPPAVDAGKPVGEWNRTKIVLNHRKLEHWLNGQKIVDCEIGSADWNERLAKSKFKAWPNFAKATKGHIDLQDHGGKVEFKNVKILVLP
jgi:Domain of Unknown Function (DUF1080)